MHHGYGDCLLDSVVTEEGRPSAYAFVKMGMTVSRQSANVTATNQQQQQQQEEQSQPPLAEETDGSARVVLITGCSTGIGLSTAAILAADADKRFRVYATMRNLEKKSALEEAAGRHLEETLFIKALDVCNEASVNSLVTEIENEEGRIDVLGEL